MIQHDPRGAGRCLAATGLIALCLFAPCLLGGAALAQEVDQKLSAADLAALVSKPVNGRASNNFFRGEHFIMQQQLRRAAGEVEVHAITQDFFIIQHGAADIEMGGTVQGGRDTAPNERRGGTIVGGHIRSITDGDVLLIPAGMPHLVIPRGPEGIRYMVVKIDTKTAAAP